MGMLKVCFCYPALSLNTALQAEIWRAGCACLPGVLQGQDCRLVSVFTKPAPRSVCLPSLALSTAVPVLLF